MKKPLLFLLLAFSLLLSNAQQTSIQLATGMYSNNTPIPHGDPDDTWRVQTPSGLNKDAKVCYAHSGWINGSGCSRWITPYIKLNHEPENCVAGAYIFKMNFNYTINPCAPVTSITLNLNSLAADNDVHTFRLNGNAYPLRPGPQDFASFTSETVTINTTDIVSGTNYVEIVVANTNPNYVCGLNICGTLNINATPVPALQPSFYAAPSYCQGGLTFTGTDGAGTATTTTWDLIEWDNTNSVPVPNGYTTGVTMNGAPGTYSFAHQPLIPCNRYYLVKMTIDNNCQGPVWAAHVIYLACNPVNAGPDQTVTCPGNCVQIGTPAQGGYSYRWTNSSGTIIGTTAIITVCPTVTSTYTLTVTNQAFNCSSSDQVTVTVTGTNNPAFVLDTFNTVSYVTCTATPVVTNANTVAGFGEMYIVEEIHPVSYQTIPGTNSAQGNNPNPPCWWIYPATLNFKGYNGTQNVGTNANCHLVTPVPGRFTLCRTYRITRGTWNANCPWRQYSLQFTCYCPSEARQAAGSTEIKEVTAPDYSYLQPGHIAAATTTSTNNELIVYPNPGPGIFTVDAAAFSSGTLKVFDQSGTLIKTMSIPGKRSSISIDLSRNLPGSYIIRIESNGKLYTEKILLLK
jgi:hypothetical protein